MRNDIYWASIPDSEECVKEVKARIEDYRQHLRDSGRSYAMKRAWNTNYGRSPDGNKSTVALMSAGTQGEIINMAVNHFGALVNQVVVLITSARPAFKAIATTSDYSSLAQTHLADGLNAYYERDMSLAEKEVSVVRNAVVLSEGYLSMSWNTALGRETGVSPDGTKPVREGDIEFTVHTPFDVAFDDLSQDMDSLNWVCIRRRVSRWDLAALYPERTDSITMHGEQDANITETEFGSDGQSAFKGNKDMVWVWEFRHKPTPALPNGRLIKFLSARCVLFDTIDVDKTTGERVDYGYPYEDLSFYGMTCEDVAGSMHGFTPFFDILGLQEGVDMVASAAATNISFGAVNNVWAHPASNLSLDQISGGMNWIKSETKPEILNLAHVSVDAMNFAELCIKWMRQRVAMNDVVMGEPTKGMPAQAMALLHAQAIQFHSKLQQNYQRMVERIRTGMLRLLKRYATSDRVALITGKSSSWALKEFTKEDLSGVDRFIIEAVNPASKTFAVKMQMAQDLLQHNAITSEQYASLLDTGRIEPLYEAPAANQARIQAEKELLQQGIGIAPVDAQTGQPVHDGRQYVMPLISDTHWKDIPEMLAVINTPEARNNPAVVQAVLNTVMKKIELWEQQPQAFQVTQGGHPAPPRMAQPPMPPQMGPPHGPPPPPHAAPHGQPGMSQSPLTALQQNSPNVNLSKMPQPPKNPITGEREPAPNPAAVS